MKKKGFTLVELLIVIAILAILFSVAYVAIDPAERMKESRDNQRLQDIHNIAEAFRFYALDHGGYPEESDGYNGYIGQGSGPDNILEEYMGTVPTDPDHDGTTYYYYFDAQHSCWKGYAQITGALTIYNFESEEYQNNYSNFSDVCPSGYWGTEGGKTPDYVLLFTKLD